MGDGQEGKRGTLLKAHTTWEMIQVLVSNNHEPVHGKEEDGQEGRRKKRRGVLLMTVTAGDMNQVPVSLWSEPVHGNGRARSQEEEVESARGMLL